MQDVIRRTIGLVILAFIAWQAADKNWLDNKFDSFDKIVGLAAIAVAGFLCVLAVNLLYRRLVIIALVITVVACLWAEHVFTSVNTVDIIAGVCLVIALWAFIVFDGSTLRAFLSGKRRNDAWRPEPEDDTTEWAAAR